MIKRLKEDYLPRVTEVFIIIFVAGSVFSIAVTQTALGFALLSWSLFMIFQRRSPLVRCRYDWFFVAFIVIGILSVIFAVEKGIWMPFLKRVALIPIVYLIAGAVSGRKMAGRLVFTLSAVMLLFSFIGIWKYLASSGERLRLYNHYMTSGGILMIVALATFAFTLVKSPLRIRLMALASGVVMIVPLVFTFTRSSWLGLLGGLAVMMLIQRRKMLAVLVPAVVILVLLAPASVRERALSSFDPGHSSNIERTYMWKAGIEMIRDHPVTGVGDMDLSELYREYRSDEAQQVHGHLHNNLIMIGAIMGIPGLVLFLSMFGWIFLSQVRTVLRVAQNDWLLRGVVLGSVGVMTGFQINGLFEWNFGDSEIIMLLWIFVGLSLAVERIISREAIVSGDGSSLFRGMSAAHPERDQ